MGDKSVPISNLSGPPAEDDSERANDDSMAGSPEGDDPPSDSNAKTQAPMQKRRRVTRACDECRRKKIKCDGKQPCTHCTVYSYDCTYDQPSNRRRNPAPQYIEALEQRLHKTEAILRSVLPGVDLDDPKFDARGVDQIIESSKAVPIAKKQTDAPKVEDEGQLQPMVDRVGSLDIDDQGNYDFHGHSSGFHFMRRFRAQFGESFLPLPYQMANPRAKNIQNIQHLLESPKSSQGSPYELNLSAVVDLPPREAAIELCRNALDDCCALMRPVHRPTFFKRLHSIYDTDPEHYNNDQLKFLPLLYVVMGLGCLFSKTANEQSMLDLKGYKEAIEQGYQYFNAGKQMLDITDCRDLITIQTVFFMILFLQSSAKLATCYAYIGIALRACCRLGLHRDLPNKFNPIELEERKRVFWLVRKMDTYVGAMLGLPQMLSDDDIDQELPAEVHDECITAEGMNTMPVGDFPLIKASNAHTRLTTILRKVVRYIYPIKGSLAVLAGDKYTISHGRIRELERDLQQWMDELPMELRPSEDAGIELSRVQQLLRISYAHVQMMMYRPFIHYVTQACQMGQGGDKRSFACAAACVSVARNIVHITSEMKRRGLLIGAYWFVMYTTFFAIVSLVYFVLENPDSPTGKDILRDAMEGKDTLASLAKRSLAADRCSLSLSTLFDELPEKLKERRSSIRPSPAGKKRPAATVETAQSNSSTPNIAVPNQTKNSGATRARTLPQDYLAKIAKRNSMPDHATPPSFPMPVDLNPSPSSSHMHGINSPAVASPLSQQFDFNTPQMAHAQIPDLKNVMFPSDNPFAYPNQPISTLEASNPQFGFQDSESFPGSSEASMMGTPASLPNHMMATSNEQQPPQFDMGSRRMYDAEPHLTQQYQPGRQFSVPMPGFAGSMPGYGGQAPMYDMSSQMTQEDYWTQIGKGNAATRTGFTPGASVNLDELFGGDGWAGVWEQQPGIPR